jgi:hypothetical protein
MMYYMMKSGIRLTGLSAKAAANCIDPWPRSTVLVVLVAARGRPAHRRGRATAATRLLHHRLRHAGPQEILLILLQQLFQCGVACRSQNLSIGLTKAGRSREYDLVWAAGRTRGSRGPGKAWTPRKARVLGGPAPSLQIAQPFVPRSTASPWQSTRRGLFHAVKRLVLDTNFGGS